jgi:hypothetical protein
MSRIALISGDGIRQRAHARDIPLGMRFQLGLFINTRRVQLFEPVVAAARCRAEPARSRSARDRDVRED